MEIVFMETLKLDDEPYTTSEVIAHYAGVQHKAVQYLTVKHQKRLEKFGVLTFEMRKPPKGSKGGRPTKVYHYNEQQATLLITFLDNTDVVADFKTELVRQFYAMKQELMQRQLVRQSGKSDRKTLTAAIHDSSVIDDNWYDYANFTNLVYKAALGFNANQLRKARNVNPKASPLDFLTVDELAAVNKVQDQVAVLIELDMTYQQIKTVLANKGVIFQTTLAMPVTA
jgi:phage regulator Rha-like protein